MRDVFFQFFHPLQGCILGFSIFQQSAHIKHIVQVSLNLYLQLVTLSMFQLLKTKTQDKVVLAYLWKQNIITQQPTYFCLFLIVQSFPEEFDISSSLRELRGTV